MAFAMEHPGVTSVIIGPRTHEQLEDLLTCADKRLPADLLDKIDELIPPGSNVNPLNPTALPDGMQKHLRRRSF